MKELTPKKIVRELNKYIIGQSQAKKSVAIALRNRWRRQQVDRPLREEISPNNILAPLATYRLAETYLKQKNINDAEKFYLKIFEDFPEKIKKSKT